MSRAAVVITVSDSAVAGTRVDLSGPAVADRLRHLGFTVQTDLASDDKGVLETTLRKHLADPGVCAVFTTGGTGLGPRDWTPEVTRLVIDREIPGVAEWMRLQGHTFTSRSILSRGIAGAAGRTLVVNLPGSPAGAIESLNAIAEVLPHAIDLLEGNTEHPAAPKLHRKA